MEQRKEEICAFAQEVSRRLRLALDSINGFKLMEDEKICEEVVRSVRKSVVRAVVDIEDLHDRIFLGAI